MHLRYITPCIVLFLLPLSACQTTTVGKRSQWDKYDYQTLARQRAPVDNDAYYTPPINAGCLDDSPNNSKYCQ